MPYLKDDKGNPVAKISLQPKIATLTLTWACPFECRLNETADCIHSKVHTTGNFKPNIERLPQTKADDRLIVSFRCLSQVKLK